ncbi:MAG: GYDIA family GHMP kinase [Flavobacteriaceae bacterium]
MKQLFHSNGKLLLSGEYVVLDGALSLAVPTVYGQSMEVSRGASGSLKWESESHDQNLWFEKTYNLANLQPHPSDSETSDRLVQILKATQDISSEFLRPEEGFAVNCKLDFPRAWGLGTSSTLINNIAQWAGVDPYQLLNKTFGGSGYDIACAQSDDPLLYQLHNGKPRVKQIAFNPPFKDCLFFVYLNKKQDSREGISLYRRKALNRDLLVSKISEITEMIVASRDLEAFEALLVKHETLISEALNMASVKEKLFPDFSGAIKSLGAWGGDFVLATGGSDTPNYFKRKGYNDVIPYEKMILNA